MSRGESNGYQVDNGGTEILKKCKKPLDKQYKMCYNIRAVRTGTH